MKIYFIFVIYIICFCNIFLVNSVKFRVVSLSELGIITKEGKQLWESLGEKTKLPQYGLCWKRAVYDLQIGCKFLTDEVQSDLALRFTDCFLQTSGFEPLVCTNSRDVCLRNLSDRAFNAYTEFYTHTQSICYFLQSQVWHEEAQKTIEKLSDTSLMVSEQLEEAGHMQKKILDQQKESLVLQHYLLDNGKTIASALELSEEKISKIMTDFQNTAFEQKKVLFETFEKLNVLRSWIVGEVSWINSIVFYMASMIIGYLFTSSSYTKRARMYILFTLTINYFTERFIYTYVIDGLLNDYSRERFDSWIWLSRKTFIVISVILLIYSALVYYDYNVVNHKILIEIKNQNKKILNFFESNNLQFGKVIKDNVSCKIREPQIQNNSHSSFYAPHSIGSSNTPKIPKDFSVSPISSADNRKKYTNMSNIYEKYGMDDIDNVSVTSEKSQVSLMLSKRVTPYNLRSSKNKK